MASDTTSEARSIDPRILAAAKALHKHFSLENEVIADFPLDEYICCAEVALKAADEVGAATPQ